MEAEKYRDLHICGTEDYKPGDLPPEGYLNWHAWADVQLKAGIKQASCGNCGKWFTPQELSDRVLKWEARDRLGEVVRMESPLCLPCAERC